MARCYRLWALLARRSNGKGKSDRTHPCAVRRRISALKHIMEVARREHGHTVGQVGFKLVQRGLGIRQGNAFAQIGGTPPNLEAKALPEFTSQQYSEMQGFLHHGGVRRRRLGIRLFQIEGAQETRRPKEGPMTRIPRRESILIHPRSAEYSRAPKKQTPAIISVKASQ